MFTEQETDGTLSSVRVMRYNNDDDNPSWSAFEGSSLFGINKDASLNAEHPAIANHKGRPFVFWGEKDGDGVVQARGAAGPDL